MVSLHAFFCDNPSLNPNLNFFKKIQYGFKSALSKNNNAWPSGAKWNQSSDVQQQFNKNNANFNPKNDQNQKDLSYKAFLL